jgi:hypothetical protein
MILVRAKPGAKPQDLFLESLLELKVLLKVLEELELLY